MQLNLYHRKLSVISDYMYELFVTLKNEKLLLEYQHTDILFFKCDKDF